MAPLLEAVEYLKPREISTLSADERLTLGRAHAYRFGNCTLSERSNRSHGTDVAAGLHTMAASEFGEGLTVAMYLDLAARVHRMRGSPFFDPWKIKAALAAPERHTA